MPKDHVVGQGECVLSIAHQEGFFWETVWNAPANSQLKSKRQDPNVLLPGDVVHVPDREQKSEPGATEQHHPFRRKGQPAKLRLRLIRSRLDEEPVEEDDTSQSWQFHDTPPPSSTDEPRADTPYILYVNGAWAAEGRTDADGRLEEKLPVGARNGKLVLDPGTQDEVSLDLSFRFMDPVSELVGVCKRLVNLGFQCPFEHEEVTPAVSAALRAFQKKNGLTETGEPDQPTRDALLAQHGG